MQGTDQQAYDRGTTIFSPEGRLYQVDYAREAVKQGAPVVGVRGAEAVVLAARVSPRSPLVEARSVEKLHRVDDHLGIASAGHAADARRLVDLARRAAQGERLRYDEGATVPTLATTIADHVQEQTQSGGTRPYGTALLLAGHDANPRLFEIDPSGATSEWRADAVGRGADRTLDVFEDRYETGLNDEAALHLALDGLAGDDEPSPGEVDATRIDGKGYAPVPDEEIESAL